MMSLTLDCHLDCDRLLGRQKGDPPFQFEYCPLFCDDSPPSSDEWHIVSFLNRDCLSMGDQVFVFRLQLIRPNFEPVDAVLKIDHSGQRWKELEDEARVYNNLLPDYQNHLIPNYHGCFRTSVGEKTIACVITECSDKPMTSCLYDADPTFLSILIGEVDALHLSGASHGDLCTSNILVKDGKPILIDLKAAKPHVCGRQLDIKQGV
ncbi:hypothetical protein DFH06DRAFT_1186784, partial [Mycena polygramma]